MSWQSVAAADVAPQPWKNGGGLTRELLAWPTREDWRVRISVADVTANGPFSCFDGVQRWFAVLQGAGVRLTVDGQLFDLRRSSPAFSFDGAAAVECELIDGPTQDFNLMLRDARGGLRRIGGTMQARPDAASLIAVYAISATATARFGRAFGGAPGGACGGTFDGTFDGAERLVAPGELLWARVDALQQVTLQADDALWMEIQLEPGL